MKSSNIIFYICNYCKKKFTLLPYSCRCLNIYCKRHKLAEDHECTFDYVQTFKDQQLERIRNLRD